MKRIDVELQAATDSALALLREAEAAGAAAFSTSFGAEDMVVLDLIGAHGLAIEVFTLDTGRLPEETHDLMRRAEDRYGPCFETYLPDAGALQTLLASDGANGFRDSVAQRKSCCAVRKIEPLRRALAGRAAWVTGLRAQQSAERAGVAARGFDAAFGVEKFSPLHDWSDAMVWAYVHAHGVPVNALHARSYPSIGCAPCTRAVRPGEDPRAGRWWWEQGANKECGLHARDARHPARQEAATA
jgi:phosphoadenosine phosphosulfate reductase